MRIDYYTLHFSIPTSEALDRINIVFKEYIEKDSSVKTKEGFDTVTLHEYPALEERFPEYSSFIIEPISDLNDEEYQRLAIALSKMLEAKIGNTALFMNDIEAEPLSVKLPKDKLEDNRQTTINDKWMRNYYLKAKSIVKGGKQGVVINNKTTENFKNILLVLSEALIQLYEDSM